jgi:tetratricopeptide (TPR) repeat protein
MSWVQAGSNTYLPLGYIWLDVWGEEALWRDLAVNRALGARNWGAYGEAVRLLEELLAQALDVGDRRHAAYARAFLGVMARDQGDYDRAAALYHESLAAFQEVEDAFGTAVALVGLSDVARDCGDAEGASAFAEQSLRLVRELGDTLFTAFCLHNLGLAARYDGDRDRADALFAESVALLRELGGNQEVPVAEVLASVGLTALDRGDYRRAGEVFTESLTIAGKAGARWVLGTLLEGMASVAVGQGQVECAARLFGAAQAVRTALGTPIRPANRALYEAHIAAARTALDEDDFARGWEGGRAMTPEQAIEDALDGARGSERPGDSPPRDGD